MVSHLFPPGRARATGYRYHLPPVLPAEIVAYGNLTRRVRAINRLAGAPLRARAQTAQLPRLVYTRFADRAEMVETQNGTMYVRHIFKITSDVIDPRSKTSP